ncbi:hypothetical protein B0F90DRAFT_1749956 [Multifurca ochricompacta]|uniref:NAD-dependent epimerase/dehydratase domain-containing protein n=1 Tax=Multifurca ochricompacta TaxID=376703 RepID=A0AAD4M143_9AGAM|nr:hypothetical protein B0F90DRAFT_1749956 [Multifurca ochricompacta]
MTAVAAGKSALVIGATGQVGQHVLYEVLRSTHFTRVCEAGRRLTQIESLPEDVKKVAGNGGKLEQLKVVDFGDDDVSSRGGGGGGERKWQETFRQGAFDVIFIALGTNMHDAKTRENFKRVDMDYTLNVARYAKTEDASHHQRLIYVSSNAAKKDSYSFYSRSKADTEQGLADLGYEDTIIFRPGFLRNTNRPVLRPIEVIAGPISTGLSFFTNKLEINVDQLGKSIRIAGEQGTIGLPPIAEATSTNWGVSGSRNFTVVMNRGARALAQENI